MMMMVVSLKDWSSHLPSSIRAHVASNYPKSWRLRKRHRSLSPHQGPQPLTRRMTWRSDLSSTTMRTSARVDCFKTPNIFRRNASPVRELVPTTYPRARQQSSLPLKHGQIAPNPRSPHHRPLHVSFRRSDYPPRLHHVLNRHALIPIRRCSPHLPQVAVPSLRQNPAVCGVRNLIRDLSLSLHPLPKSISRARLHFLH